MDARFAAYWAKAARQRSGLSSICEIRGKRGCFGRLHPACIPATKSAQPAPLSFLSKAIAECQRGRLKGSEGLCVYERHARACARNSDMPESLQRSSDGRCRATWAKQVGSAFLAPRLGQDALGFVRCQSVHFDGAGELPPLLGPRHPLAASLASVPVSLSHSFLTTRFRKPC